MKPINILEHKGVFFKILATAEKSQIGVMTIEPGSDSGPEDIHPGEQIVYVIEGDMTVETQGKRVVVPEGHVFVIASGAQHHLYNKGDKPLFFLTIYTPPAY